MTITVTEKSSCAELQFSMKYKKRSSGIRRGRRRGRPQPPRGPELRLHRVPSRVPHWPPGVPRFPDRVTLPRCSGFPIPLREPPLPRLPHSTGLPVPGHIPPLARFIPCRVFGVLVLRGVWGTPASFFGTFSGARRGQGGAGRAGQRRRRPGGRVVLLENLIKYSIHP